MVKELPSLIAMSEDIFDDPESLREIIGSCGSFLTIREGTIYFVHQSANDYLLTYVSDEIFPSGRGDAHYFVFSRSLQAMSRTLRQDIYKLSLPRISINLIQVPDPDPLAPLQYSCVYWASHLQEAYRSSVLYQRDLADSGKTDRFLQDYFLYWLEALSLIRKLSEGVLAITSLEPDILVSHFHTRNRIRTNQR
jgi:hypothetical protein